MDKKSLFLSPKSFVAGAVALIAIAIIGFGQYRNSVAKDEIVSFFEEANKNARAMGSSVEYSSVDCSGMFTTDCSIKNIEAGSMFFDKLTIGEVNIKSIEKLRGFKDMSDGKKSNASFDIEINKISIPETIINILQNDYDGSGNNYFIDIFKNMDIALKGEMSGSKDFLDKLTIENFKINNDIVPMEVALSIKDASLQNPKDMTLESAFLNIEYKNMEILAKEIANIDSVLPLAELQQAALDTIIKELEEGEQNSFQKGISLAIADVFKGKGNKISIDLKPKDKNLKLYQLEELIDNPESNIDSVLDLNIKVY